MSTATGHPRGAFFLRVFGIGADPSQKSPPNSQPISTLAHSQGYHMTKPDKSDPKEPTTAERLTMARKAVATSETKLAEAQADLEAARAKYPAAIDSGDHQAAIGAQATINAAEVELDICQRVLEKARINAAEVERIQQTEELRACERVASWTALRAALLPHLGALADIRENLVATLGAIETVFWSAHVAYTRAKELAAILRTTTSARDLGIGAVRALALDHLSRVPRSAMWRGLGGTFNDWLAIETREQPRAHAVRDLFGAGFANGQRPEDHAARLLELGDVLTASKPPAEPGAA